MAIFGGHHKTGLVLWVISMRFRVFSYCQCTAWGIFFGLLKFQIYFGVCLIVQIFVLVMVGQSLRRKKN